MDIYEHISYIIIYVYIFTYILIQKIFYREGVISYNSFHEIHREYTTNLYYFVISYNNCNSQGNQKLFLEFHNTFLRF